MKKTANIKKAILSIFLLSFVFQTAYSLSFKVSNAASPDYCHKYIQKAPANEEASANSFIENETENNNELDFEVSAFILPQFFHQVIAETGDVPHVSAPLSLSSNKQSIFVVIRNFRI